MVFAERALSALGFLLAGVLVLRLVIRLDQDRVTLWHASSDQWGNVSWKIARDLHEHGVAPGAGIAVIGPHAEAYWARSGRMHIVADVPPPRAEAFWRLSRASQDSLLTEFARAGASVAIASVGPDRGSPDTTWRPVHYGGWIRPLARSAR